MLNLHRSLLWLLMSLMLLASSFSAYHGTQHVFDVQNYEKYSHEKHSHEQQNHQQYGFSFSPVYQLSHGLNEHHERSYESCDKCLLLSNLHGVDALTLNLGLSAQLLPAVEPCLTDLPNRTRASYFSRAPPITA